jgi:hypothetical protein
MTCPSSPPCLSCGIHVALPVVILLSSCGVASDEAGPSGSDAPALGLKHVVTIGEPEVEFAAIGALIADDDGNLYVADTHPLVNRVLIIDEDGAERGGFGRVGPGPGEFGRLLPMLGWVEDLLLTVDGGSFRTEVFTRTGEFVSSVPFEVAHR